MAQFPDVLLTSYIPVGTPNIKSADLNAMQRWAVQLNKIIRGGNLWMYDEFLGDTVNRSYWITPTAALTIFSGSGESASGVLVANPATGTATISQTGPTFAIGANDFRMRFRLAITNYTTLLNANDLFIYMEGTHWLAFHFKRTVGAVFNVQVQVDNGTDIDTGVAVPANSVYADYEIRRENGVATFLINDVAVYSQAYTQTDLGSIILSDSYNAAAPAGGLIAHFDYFKVWVDRQPVASATGAAQLGAHTEAFNVSFAGGNATVNFNSAFGDTTYKIFQGVPVGAGPIPAFIIQTANKQTGSVVIEPSFPWTGTCSFLFSE